VDPNATASSRRRQALFQLLRTADVLWEASRVFFAQWDISPSQFNILNLLADYPEGLSQTDLGRELLTHRSNVTGLVDRLEKRGLVQRKDVSGDRRAYRVVLSREGGSLLNVILPQYYQRAERVWNEIPGKDISGLVRTLEQVGANAMNAVTAPARSRQTGRV
jgi:DNA-binding MarR family transcriptional regulator